MRRPTEGEMRLVAEHLKEEDISTGGVETTTRAVEKKIYPTNLGCSYELHAPFPL